MEEQSRARISWNREEKKNKWVETKKKKRRNNLPWEDDGVRQRDIDGNEQTGMPRHGSDGNERTDLQRHEVSGSRGVILRFAFVHFAGEKKKIGESEEGNAKKREKMKMG